MIYPLLNMKLGITRRLQILSVGLRPISFKIVGQTKKHIALKTRLSITEFSRLFKGPVGTLQELDAYCEHLA